MNPAERTELTRLLREHVSRIAQDIRAQVRAPGVARERALRLHADEKVGDDFDVWTDLLSRRAAVLWVLKSVYVRVLEDRGLLAPGRILDPEAQQLFEHLAPNLGETAFLKWVYRDLASRDGGLPELFAPQPAEVALPADALSRDLIGFWRHRDADTGAQWSFADERFEGELMGDLYQELDPVVKARYALCQTPDFVREFILDRTLTPAIQEFGADQVRLLDPTCGSGHFLIDGLKRLVAATADSHPEWSRLDTVKHCLDRVVGMDLNDYACGLARARLIMTAAELAGMKTLAEAAALHPRVYWADGLEQVEREVGPRGDQLTLFEGGSGAGAEAAPVASWTPAEVRVVLAEVLREKFHAVVGNPPYITEKDARKKAYHREKLATGPRYVSAYLKYSLGGTFVERSFALAATDGYVGVITSNNFMKREFGRPTIESVIARRDLTLVLDTSMAFIPHFGTATVTIFARNRPPRERTVRAVMGKRGEPARPSEPRQGKVWQGIVAGFAHAGFENEFVSVADVPRGTFERHPWSLGGGGASDVLDALNFAGNTQLSSKALIGVLGMTNADEVMVLPPNTFARRRIERDYSRPLVLGDGVRDWAEKISNWVAFPYYDEKLIDIRIAPNLYRWLWNARTTLGNRATFGHGTYFSDGLPWYKWHQIALERIRTPLSITSVELATHNHFVLDRGGKVFNRTAPIIKLAAEATEDDHLALLGLLNSSTACFWMKQMFQAKAAGGIGRGLESESWMERYAYDASKMKRFPIPANHTATIPHARALDAIAARRAAASVTALLADHARWRDAATLREALRERRGTDLLDLHRMVALQEELDWLCYTLYGLLDGIDPDVTAPDAVAPVPPTWLPWVLNLAERDAEIREALARGEETDESPTAWFERHRWTPLTALPDDAPEAYRQKVARRRELIAQVPALGLIETATYKRRWYCPDYEGDEKTALETWLADAIEAVVEKRERPCTLSQICAALQDQPRVLAVAEVLENRRDFDLAALVARLVDVDAVPNHRFHLYKETGLDKRAAWEKTWEDQRREDAGEPVKPEVPPTYGSVDFLRNEHWQLRGKLDVPKERFIAFTEVPNRSGPDTLYVWAGWTPVQRLKALLAVDENLEDAGVPLADRAGVLDSAWRLLPWVAADDPAAAHRLKAELQALVGPDGPSRETLDDWRQRFPPPGTRGSRGRKAKASPST